MLATAFQGQQFPGTYNTANTLFPERVRTCRIAARDVACLLFASQHRLKGSEAWCTLALSQMSIRA